MVWQAALASLGLISVQQPETPPTFTFREVEAGKPTEFRTFGFCRRGLSNPNERVCSRSGTRRGDAGQVADVGLIELYATSYQGRVTSIIGAFDRIDHVRIESAFTAKYGEPCERTTEEWRSRLGLKLPNDVTVWCFATGKLYLESVGRLVSHGRFTYTDEWQAPKPEPKIDF